MTEHDRAAICLRAVTHFGPHSRLLKTAEECSELAAAITRWINPGEGHDPAQVFDGMIEEVADVTIMIAQLGSMLGDRADSKGRTWQMIMEEKLRALEARMNAEREEAVLDGDDD